MLEAAYPYVGWTLCVLYALTVVYEILKAIAKEKDYVI